MRGIVGRIGAAAASTLRSHGARTRAHTTSTGVRRILIASVTAAAATTAATLASSHAIPAFSSSLHSILSSVIPSAACVGHDYDDDDDPHKHAVATKTWHYYSGPAAAKDLPHLRLFTGTSNPELAVEIAHYLGVPLSPAIVDHFADGETKIQILENVRQTHCFVVQSTAAPVNDSLMELLLLVSSLRRASAQEITVLIPYFGYERQDRKLSSRVPISAADVAIMLSTMGVDRVVAVDLHSGQVQGFFPPSIPVENLDSMTIASLYFSEKHLKRPVIVAASAGGVIRAKHFREGMLEQGIETDLAMLIEGREADAAGRFSADSRGVLDLVGSVKGCDCILIEDIIDTGSTMQHAAEELKRRGSRNVYAFCTHGLFSAPDSPEKIAQSPLKELVTTNTVAMRPAVQRIDKLTVLTLAPLLAETIRRIYQKRSLSEIYQHTAKPTVLATPPAPTKAE